MRVWMGSVGVHCSSVKAEGKRLGLRRIGGKRQVMRGKEKAGRAEIEREKGR